MANRAEMRKKAEELVARCKEDGIRIPSDEQKARMAAGMALSAADGDPAKALEHLEEKYGVSAVKKKPDSKKKPSRKKKEESEEEEEEEDVPKKKKRGRPKKEQKEEEEDEEEAEEAEKKKTKKIRAKKAKKEDSEEGEESDKKKKKGVEIVCPENEGLYEAFSELKGFEFKHGNRFQAMTYAKLGKIIREFERPVKSGKDLDGIKGIGKVSKEKVQEFIDTGSIKKLEEYREAM